MLRNNRDDDDDVDDNDAFCYRVVQFLSDFDNISVCFLKL